MKLTAIGFTSDDEPENDLKGNGLAGLFILLNFVETQPELTARIFERSLDKKQRPLPLAKTLFDAQAKIYQTLKTKPGQKNWRRGLL